MSLFEKENLIRNIKDKRCKVYYYLEKYEVDLVLYRSK